MDLSRQRAREGRPTGRIVVSGGVILQGDVLEQLATLADDLGLGV